jgi:hypothetical protein
MRELAMKEAVVIALSRAEEETMRLIGHGIGNPKHLWALDVDQLKKLRLAEEKDGRVGLTELGRIRMAQSQERFFQAVVRAAHQESSLRLG